MTAYNRGDRWLDWTIYLFLTLLSFLCLYPFYYLLVIAFNAGTDTLRGGLSFFPREFTLANFMAILTDPIIMGAYKVTILRTVIGTLASVSITALVAYGLSESRLPYRKYIMIYMLIPMVFSGGLIPMYLNLKGLGLINTFWIFIIPAIFNIWNCIVMKTFFQEIPQELKESMRIDGAKELLILLRLVFPIALPMFAAIALFVAVAHWNDWFTGAFFVFKQDLMPVQTYLQNMMTRQMGDFVGQNLQDKISLEFGNSALTDFSKVNSLSLKVAAVIVGTLPILLVYPFLQKYFVKGVLVGSVKG